MNINLILISLYSIISDTKDQNIDKVFDGMEFYKLLIVEKSLLLRNYLREQLEARGFEVGIAKDANEGIIKMKSFLPDIVIIDYSTSIDGKIDFLSEKNSYKPISNIPVIVCASKVDEDSVKKVAKHKISKFFIKPLRIDLLLQAIAELTKKEIEFDKTFSMADVNLNDDILFIEISGGLNSDKIETMSYKVKELKTIYNINNPKVLLILSDITLIDSAKPKFYTLLSNIIKYGTDKLSAIKILTNSEDIKEFILKDKRFCDIETTNDINYAINKLSDLKIDELIDKSIDKTASDDVLLWSNQIVGKEEEKDVSKNHKLKIAIVDDDEYNRIFLESALFDLKFHTTTYPDGFDFIQDVKKNTPDLLFLDIMMPKMGGLEVLENLKKMNISFPVIIFSTINQRETVLQVKKYGIKHYIVKPVTHKIVLSKIKEIFQSNF